MSNYLIVIISWPIVGVCALIVASFLGKSYIDRSDIAIGVTFGYVCLIPMSYEILMRILVIWQDKGVLFDWREEKGED